MENNEKKDGKKGAEFFSGFMSKASDIGKKAADGISKGAKNLSESTKEHLHEQRLKKYNPLFKETFRNKKFKLPNVIEIVDAVTRRNVDVCEGAIGWTDKVNDIEILYLYEEWVKESKIQFLPYPKCDAVYCVDNFEQGKFVNVDSAFERTISEKLAELEHIAYSLGAKMCSVEIVETDSNIKTSNSKFQLKGHVNADHTAVSQQQNLQSGKNVSHFEGSDNPQKPTLKWFSCDDNILGLIDMRCTGKNTIKSKVLELNCSSSATMSQKTACAIDKIMKTKATMTMEKKAVQEHCSKMIFEIEF